MSNERNAVVGGLIAGMVLVTFIIGLMFAWPIYNVWSSRKAGEAALAESQAAKQVILEEAKAKAEAEKVRAEGLAAAIEKTGQALRDNPEYTRHRFIEGLHDDSTEVIYLPIGNDGLPQMFTHPVGQVPSSSK